MNEPPFKPVVEITPAACAEIRRALDHGIAAFNRWGIDSPPGSWIQQAADWLDHVVAADSLGDTDEELAQTSAAIAVAVDLYHIGTTLGDEANRQVAAELSAILHGKLGGRGDLAAGKDVLTQFWVGALLAQSKLYPQVIAYDVPQRAKPDFVIPKSGVRFAVEVKRPRSSSSAKRAVLKAASQTRTFPGPGIIVIDATECLSVDPWAVNRSPRRMKEQLRSELEVLHQSFLDLISSYKRSGKFSQVAMLMTFVRHWNWEVTANGEASRDSGLLFRAYGFGYLWSVQITRITRDIQDALLNGVEHLTGNPPVYRYF